jgi:hypothetical protein
MSGGGQWPKSWCSELRAGGRESRGLLPGLGFEPTGEVLEGEVVMSLRVNDRSGRTAE